MKRIIFLAATVASAAPRIGALAEATTCRLAGVFSDLFAEPFYAKDAGAFTKAGFDVSAISLNNAGAVAAAIGGGSLRDGDRRPDLRRQRDQRRRADRAVGRRRTVQGTHRRRLDDSGRGGRFADQDAQGPRREIDRRADAGRDDDGVSARMAAGARHRRGRGEAHRDPAVGGTARVATRNDRRGSAQRTVRHVRNSVRSVGSPFDAAADLTANKVFCVSVWYAAKSWFEADPARRAASCRRSTIPRAGPTAIATIRSTSSCATASSTPTKRRGMQRTTYATTLTPAMVEPVGDISLERGQDLRPEDRCCDDHYEEKSSRTRTGGVLLVRFRLIGRRSCVRRRSDLIREEHGPSLVKVGETY